MKYNVAIAAITAALASAKDCNLPPSSEAVRPGDIFKLVALPKAENEIECQTFQALNNSLFIGNTNQLANCTSKKPRQYASFSLSQHGFLFLYTGNTSEKFETQQIYVDRSGMGQGFIGFTTGNNVPIGRNQERGPFNLTSTSDLVFDDGNGAVSAFQACPPPDGSESTGWKVWLGSLPTPGGSEGCVRLNARAVKDDAPEACEYYVPLRLLSPGHNATQ